MGGEPNRTGDPKTKPEAETLTSFGVHWGLYPGSYLALLVQKKLEKTQRHKDATPTNVPQKEWPASGKFFFFFCLRRVDAPQWGECNGAKHITQEDGMEGEPVRQTRRGVEPRPSENRNK